MPGVAIIHNHPVHYKHLLFTALAKKDLDFHVFFTARSGGEQFGTVLPTRDGYRYSIGFDGSYKLASASRAARFVWKSLDHMRPDVVIISGYYDAAGWAAWTWASLHGVSKILWAESNEFDYSRRAWKEAIKRVFVSRCDAAHVYGTSNRKYLELLGMSPGKIYTKRAVADTALFGVGRLTSVPKAGPLVLLYVGRFSPEKNLSFLLRAFAQVPQSRDDLKLVLALVGYGPLEDDLHRRVAELKLLSRVQFWGKAIQSELVAAYQRADAFILPSITEPWGLVANEAMLCGLPVLLSDRCGCAADLILPETGWTFSPIDEAALTHRLTRLAATPRHVLQRMGAAAKELASSYSPEASAGVVLTSVKALLSGKECSAAGQGSR